MLRRVRLRLIVWSAGSTLVVLVVLGVALYWAVAQTLVSQSTRALEDRITLVGAKIAAASEYVEPTPPPPQPNGEDGPKDTASGSMRPEPSPNPSQSAPTNTVNLTTDASQPGLTLGGPASGSIAFVLDPDGGIALKLLTTPDGSSANVDIPEPDKARVDAARAGQTVVWEGDLHGIPARFVLAAIPTNSGPVLIESIGDRTSEIALLRTLLKMLLLVGLAAIAAAVAFGYFYAGRALIPIRRSLQRQRDFAADASHELRTPLAIVRGAAEELRGGSLEADSRARSIADIEAGAERLTQLVDDLLLLARADSGVLELRQEAVDLAEVATDSVAQFARIAADRSVRLRLDTGPALVRGDPERLSQLVGILVDNAIRHSPESGGTVSILVRDGAALVVEDEGPGIRPEDLPRLFDRFWRAADAPAGGTGLGLAIAAWIAESHGGSLSAGNRPEGGARFEVEIPALN